MPEHLTADDVRHAVKEHNVSFIQIWFTDVLGVLKSFAITPGELDEAMTALRNRPLEAAYPYLWLDAAKCTPLVGHFLGCA